MKYIIGLGKTGTSLIHYLLNCRQPFAAWDDNEVLQKKARSIGCTIVSPDKAPWHEIEELILSPGVPTLYPVPHQAVQFANKHKVPFRGDMDFWYQTIQQLKCKFIGITGTNGKSTTHAIVDYILKSSNKKCFSGGNNGIPVFSAEGLKTGSIINLEMSSYQLDILKEMKFDAGVILNITPDHLERHGNMENYIQSKKIQIEKTKDDGIKIMGIDNQYSLQAYNELIESGIKNLIPISTFQNLKNGVYARENQVFSMESGREVLLGEIPAILPGAHNAQNIMAAMLVCRFFGVSIEDFFKLLPFYPGLVHRQERVIDTPKALFINDSKATNADATLPALKAYSNIYWIVGGIPKEEGVVPLLPYLQNIEKVFLIGQAAKRFQLELSEIEDKISVVHTLEGALEEVVKDLKNINHKVTVLLSPACASQDQFQNFEHRGQVFKELVKQYAGEI